MAVAVDVYLVRHAIAEQRDAARWPDDSLRPLSAEGAESFRHAARGLRRIVPEVETVLASSYVRAWQTAEILEREAGWPAPERCEALEGNPDPEEARAEILALRGRGSVALVGHDPHLSRLASLLLTGDPDGMRLELKKGGVVHLELEPDEEATASLHASVTPKALRRTRGRRFESRRRHAGRPNRPRRRRRRVTRQAPRLARGRGASALRLGPRPDASGDGRRRRRRDGRLVLRRRLDRDPGAGARRACRLGAGQSRPRLGRVRSRAGIRQADEGGQRRRAAGARQLRGREDAVPRSRHRARLGARRRRHRRADGAGHLPFRKATFEDYVGNAGRKRLGKKKWQQAVEETVERLTAALEPDYVVLGGGNAKKLDSLPPNVRLGANNNAFVGAFRLWGRELSASPP